MFVYIFNDLNQLHWKTTVDILHNIIVLSQFVHEKWIKRYIRGLFESKYRVKLNHAKKLASSESVLLMHKLVI